MDAMTYALTALAIACGVLLWIAWKQELRDRDRAKQKKEQNL